MPQSTRGSDLSAEKSFVPDPRLLQAVEFEGLWGVGFRVSVMQPQDMLWIPELLSLNYSGSCCYELYTPESDTLDSPQC